MKKYGFLLVALFLLGASVGSYGQILDTLPIRVIKSRITLTDIKPKYGQLPDQKDLQPNRPFPTKWILIGTGSLGGAVLTYFLITAEQTTSEGQPPIAHCQNGMVSLGANGTATIQPSTVDNGSDDPDEGNITLNLSQSTFTCTHIGANVVVLTVTDEDGMTDQCEATIQVVDEQAPVINCPGDLEVPTDPGLCTTTLTIDVPDATDNCALGDLANDFTGTENASGEYPAGSTTVVYTATDESGNSTTCSFQVTVSEEEPPTLSCPPDVNTTTHPGVCTADLSIELPEALDNCGIPGVINDFNGAGDASGLYSSGVTTVLWTATDDAGNTATCTTTITVLDEEIPVINCPDDIQTTTDPGGCETYVEVPLPEVTENCGIDTLINTYNGTGDASDTYPGGQTVVVFTVLDLSGNQATCFFNIFVEDEEAPLISCPDDITVPASMTGMTFVPVPLPTTSDNCGISTVSNSYNGTSNASGFYPTGATEVVWTAEDLNGNSNTCTMTITVEETPCNAFLEGWVVEPPTDSTAGTLEFTVWDASPPHQVYVNGIWVGSAPGNGFILEGFGYGIFDIQIIDANNCPSNVLTFEFEEPPGFSIFAMTSNPPVFTTDLSAIISKLPGIQEWEKVEMPLPTETIAFHYNSPQSAGMEIGYPLLVGLSLQLGLTAFQTSGTAFFDNTRMAQAKVQGINWKGGLDFQLGPESSGFFIGTGISLQQLRLDVRYASRSGMQVPSPDTFLDHQWDPFVRSGMKIELNSFIRFRLEANYLPLQGRWSYLGIQAGLKF